MEMSELSWRVLKDDFLVQQLVEQDPAAGVTPAEPKTYTAEEEERSWRWRGGATRRVCRAGAATGPNRACSTARTRRTGRGCGGRRSWSSRTQR